MERRWQVLMVTSVAVVHGLPRRDDRQHRLPGHARVVRRRLARAPLVDAERVQRSSSLPRSSRRGGSRTGSGDGASSSLGIVLFLAASDGLRAAWNVDVLIAARAVQAVGGAMLVPDVARPRAARVPARAARDGDRPVGCDRRRRRGDRPGLGGLLVDWQSWRWVFFVNLLIGAAGAHSGAARSSARTGTETASLPDPLGAVLLVVAVGALSLAIVEGPSWGWSSAASIAAFVAQRRSLRSSSRARRATRAPVIELSLFRVRSFAVANAGVFVFSRGFYALLLCNVLFLTGVWHYSVVRAGVALTPGPLMAASRAPIGGRLSDRFGQRVVAVPGGLVFAAGALLFALAPVTRARVRDRTSCRRTLLTGIGVGLVFAGVRQRRRRRASPGPLRHRQRDQQHLPADRRSARHLHPDRGARPAAAVDITHFHRAWTLMAITGAVSGLTGLALGRVRARNVGEPAAAPASS